MFAQLLGQEAAQDFQREEEVVPVEIDALAIVGGGEGMVSFG